LQVESVRDESVATRHNRLCERPHPVSFTAKVKVMGYVTVTLCRTIFLPIASIMAPAPTVISTVMPSRDREGPPAALPASVRRRPWDRPPRSAEIRCSESTSTSTRPSMGHGDRRCGPSLEISG
jgi:hypothetical protein